MVVLLVNVSHISRRFPNSFSGLTPACPEQCCGDPNPLLSRKHFAPISPLAATLMHLPVSIAMKALTVLLNLLDATLTKNGEAPFTVPLAPSPFSLPCQAPSSSISYRLSCTMAAQQLFWSQRVPHSFHRDGGGGGTPNGRYTLSVDSVPYFVTSLHPCFLFPPFASRPRSARIPWNSHDT